MRVCSQTSLGSPETETVTAMVSPAQGALLSTDTLLMVSCALAVRPLQASTATSAARAVQASPRSEKNDRGKFIGISSRFFEVSRESARPRDALSRRRG